VKASDHALSVRRVVPRSYRSATCSLGRRAASVSAALSSG
jgi:hypothetical protein